MLREIGKTIKIFKSNKGTKFYNENNIKHELTCVYTLKQKGLMMAPNLWLGHFLYYFWPPTFVTT